MLLTKPHQRSPQRVHLHAYERLRQICAEIQRGRYPKKADLARIVERDPRTVQRDLEALVNRFDAPLKFDRKKNGFYFTDPTWQLPSVVLSEGELISFFTAERILRRLGATSEVQLARAALRRLAALLPDEVVVDVNALEDAITFAPEPVLDASPTTLRQLAFTATHRQTLHIHYYSQRRAAHTERDVDVLLLHNHLGEWYAVSYDHETGEIRDFHAGRITNIVNTRRPFSPPADWDAQEYLRRGFGMFRGGKEVTVEVEFDQYQARYAKERTFHPTQRGKELRDGRLRITFETTEAALEQVTRWLLQYGQHARALRPPALQTMIREQLKRAAALYDQTRDEANNE
ncbi:MAG TPA: WYL domain-containing protein [Pyrinomonadaceae bacterium]|jgi:predicted DNA-binding transcriptional regulator YafY